MAPSQPLFLGNQEMVIDGKLRVGIPERFMKALRVICPDEANCIGVWPSPDRSVKLMPAPLYREEIEKARRLDVRSEKGRIIRTLYSAHAELLTLDAQNRIKLSKQICGMCKLSGAVIVVGSFDYMQIFDLATWQEYEERGMNELSTAEDEVSRKEAEPRPVQIVLPVGQAGPEKV